MSNPQPHIPWRRLFFVTGTKLMDAARDDMADPVQVIKAARGVLDLIEADIKSSKTLGKTGAK